VALGCVLRRIVFLLPGKPEAVVGKLRGLGGVDDGFYTAVEFKREMAVLRIGNRSQEKLVLRFGLVVWRETPAASVGAGGIGKGSIELDLPCWSALGRAGRAREFAGCVPGPKVALRDHVEVLVFRGLGGRGGRPLRSGFSASFGGRSAARSAGNPDDRGKNDDAHGGQELRIHIAKPRKLAMGLEGK